MAEKAVSDRVSAIRDAEMKGYLNTKKDMIYKKIMWELMNKDYLNQQNIGHQKPKKKEDQRTKKKNNNGKRDSSAITEDEKENEKMKKQRLSAKINFDALEKMMNGGDEETVSGSDYRNRYEKNDNKNGSDENSIVAEEEEEEEDEESEGVGLNNGYGDIMGLENEDEEDEVAGYGFDEDYEGY